MHGAAVGVMAQRPKTAMSHRDPRVARFLENLVTALATRRMDPGVADAIARIQSANESNGVARSPESFRLPVCQFLARALEAARAASEPIAGVAEALIAIEPHLQWSRRHGGGPFASDNWLDGHANAMIVGPTGIETCGNLQVGVSLMAPQVRYPDHRHAPEEVYVVLSPGRFKHGASSWVEPGIGGMFHNVPNVMHAMASDDAPLLAIWSLWDA